MNDQRSHTSNPAGGGLSLRAEEGGDEPFLFELYASTREEELARTGWDNLTRAAFLNLQFRAMRQGYASMFPQAQFSLILEGGAPIGRLVVDRSGAEFHLVDIVISPAHRNRGIGTALISALLEEARQSQKPVRLQVLKHSRAIALYQRLEFSRTDETDLYEQMEWRGPKAGD